MATRRIARGRGGSPVPIIVLTVIVIGLLAATIVLGMKASDLEDVLAATQKEVKGEKDRHQDDLNAYRKYENLVGLDQAAARADRDKLAKDIEEKLPPDDRARLRDKDNNVVISMKDLLRLYADRCGQLQTDVTTRLHEVETARKELSELQKQREELQKAKQEEAEAATARYAKLQGEKDKIDGQLTETTHTLSGQIDKLKTEKRALETKVATIEKDVDLLKKTVVQKDELIAQLRNPPKPKMELIKGAGAEAADGKILTVDPDGEHVMIDIGRRDWLSEGMEFRVVDQSNPEAPKDKGRIQVRRVYDTIAQAKILQQDPLDPILRDMAILNPAFSRGRQLKFVLEGRFMQPDLERLLSRYPCVIEKTVTRDSDYLVVGEAKRKPGESSAKDSENYKNAEKFLVPILMERDMLRYLGER
jgi:hypothetical protein